MSVLIESDLKCYHCGDKCDDSICIEDKVFCCYGCKTVYDLLNQNQLCDYYNFQQGAGLKVKSIKSDRFAYLDRIEISSKFIIFKDKEWAHLKFEVPQMHCISCLWLLENLHKLNSNILSSKVDFNRKIVKVVINSDFLSVREVVELMSSIGYEPYISLEKMDEKSPKMVDRSLIYRIGIAGFCFANIMLLSFPEYLGLEISKDKDLGLTFRYLNVILALPVFFYGAAEFFKMTWIGIKRRYLNIDAPVSLAIVVTFVRSVYEIFSGIGPGYLDSMSGIVFFMLVGRYFQSKTKASLSFDHDYKTYFPVAVTKLDHGKEVPVLLHEISVSDVLKLRHDEICPVDGILSKGEAKIDYSFITGESDEKRIDTGGMIYQGGRVIDASIEILALKPFSKNSFVDLWNNQVFYQEKQDQSVIHKLSSYFSILVFLISFIAGTYWYFIDPSKSIHALSSVLIVACPCSLLLTSSFTNGYILQLFSKYGLYLKNHLVIESLAGIDTIVFDKTGTLTEPESKDIEFVGSNLTHEQLNLLISSIDNSSHPLGKMIASKYKSHSIFIPDHYKEFRHLGLESKIGNSNIKMGNKMFVLGQPEENSTESIVYCSIDERFLGKFLLKQKLRENIGDTLRNLSGYQLRVLSGDTVMKLENISSLLPSNTSLLASQSPLMKRQYVEGLQLSGKKVLMVGDGLNDAGALKQSDCGIAVVNDSFCFSPASDALLAGDHLFRIHSILKVARKSQLLIRVVFAYSIIYNIIGVGFAVSAQLTPFVAAILMPISSISIILLSYFMVKMLENKYFYKYINN
ncbi:MAG: heavy metal translocating P-type ATPase metal-binding domain-containing protein [Saprospiraceae bacterium]|nr:heavy metal translocating P-type ATPase metal-binding domain-containing protein [Candidatus Vicinibacter affinis]MBK8642802.1 heavy metal translocating P-type ATPase metal-binding domain-containing protein [Candidatus Vicinibacter affinis]